MQVLLNRKCTVALLIGVFVCCIANAQSDERKIQGIRKQVNPLDLSVPITKIKDKLTPLFEKGLNLQWLLGTLINALMNCLSSQSQSSLHDVFIVPNDVEQHIQAKYQQNYLVDLVNAPGFCNITGFPTIHNFLWVNDEGCQFRDVIEFFRKFGYPDIYTGFRNAYIKNDCPKELIDTIPTGPTPCLLDPSSTSQSNPTFIRNQVLSAISSEKNTVLQPLLLQERCDLIGTVKNLTSSGGLRLLSLVETIVEEVTTDPSLHFLVGKIQEPIKGPPFREFRLLKPIRELFLVLHEAIVNEPGIKFILELVESITGLDLSKGNIIDTVLNILEAILWKNFDPVGPYNP